MRRFVKPVIFGLLFILLVVYLDYIAVTIPPVFKGFYQSEFISSEGETREEIIQFSIWEDGTFIEFITNRKVNRGTFEKINEELYQLDGDEADFDITLKEDNSFEVIISQLNEGKPIELKYIGDTPCIFADQWDDVEKYKSYLKE